MTESSSKFERESSSKLEIIASRWRILEKLYLREKNEDGTKDGEGEPTPSSLASMLGMDLSQVSRYVTELEREKIIVCKRKDGAKWCSLTGEGMALVSGIYRTLEEVERQKDTKKELEKKLWLIDEYIDFIEDQEIDQEVRYDFANRILEFVREDPVLAFTKNDRLKNLTMDWIEGKKLGEKVDERVRVMLSVSIIRLLSDTDTGDWILEKVYPKLKSNFLREGDLGGLLSIIEMLTNIAINKPEKKDEVFGLLVRELGLGEEPPKLKVDDKILKEIENHLKAIASHYSEDLGKKLYRLLRKKLKSKDEKVKARARDIAATILV